MFKGERFRVRQCVEAMRSSSSSGNSSNGALRGAAAPLNNYEFDFGLGSGVSRGGASLNDQKHVKNTSAGTAAGPGRAAAPAGSKPWVHKPIAGMGGSSSSINKPMAMAGDITGKSWISPQTSTNADSGIVGGVGASKSDMFGDLLSLRKSKAAADPISSSSSSSFRSSSLPMNAMKGPQQQEQQQQWGNFASRNGVSSNGATDPTFAAATSTRSGPSPRTATAAAAAPVAKSDPLEDMLKKLSSKRSSTNKQQPAASFDGASEPTVTTTELQGLPPPPAGLSASVAMDKGSEFQKQGQFADAIKWLTWAEALATTASMLASILSCRIVCFKEVGEYKKAVQDCCKVMETGDASATTEVLLQRAFLYESMEKYKLGVADLREVLKRNPSHRVARNTLARLVKMVD